MTAPLPPQLLPVHQENTVAARVARRRNFRLMFALPGPAYAPDAYVNAEGPTDLTGPVIDVINAERAGASHADPS